MQSLWMLFATFMFSLMGVCVKLLSGTYSTPEIVMYRSVIGAVFMFCVMFWRRETFRTRFPLQHLWRGSVGVSAFGLWFYSISQLPLATAITLNYMSPIWIAVFLFVIMLWRNRTGFEWRLLVAVAASFVGVALLLRPTIHADQWHAGLIALFSSVLAAMAYMQVRHLGELGEPENRIVLYFCVTGSVCAGIACIVNAYLYSGDGIIWHSHGITGFLLLVAIGVTAAVGQVAMTRAYHLGKTLVTANLQYTGIVFSSIWGILIWDDVLGIYGWLGILVIVASGVSTTFFDVRQRMARIIQTADAAKKQLRRTIAQ
ncbi:MAG: DMT family transporter [Burkholderiaceae bacterium]|nr:DMT family transporter [Burkholderiaceae bacterium]